MPYSNSRGREAAKRRIKRKSDRVQQQLERQDERSSRLYYRQRRAEQPPPLRLPPRQHWTSNDTSEPAA